MGLLDEGQKWRRHDATKNFGKQRQARPKKISIPMYDWGTSKSLPGASEHAHCPLSFSRDGVGGGGIQDSGQREKTAKCEEEDVRA